MSFYKLTETVSHSFEAMGIDPLKVRRQREVARRTADVFSMLLGQRITLREGSPPHAKGWEITYDPQSPDHYALLERELAHLAFGTDPLARRFFLEKWCKSIEKVCAEQGHEFDAEGFQRAAHALACVIERHRVLSLWARIYEGSAAEIREIDKRIALEVDADESLLTRFVIVQSGLSASGRLDRFEPVMRTALQLVEGRGFAYGLAVSRWLLTQLLSELIRERHGADASTENPEDRLQALTAFAGNRGGWWTPQTGDTFDTIQESPIYDREIAEEALATAGSALTGDPSDGVFTAAQTEQAEELLERAINALSLGDAPGTAVNAHVVFHTPKPARLGRAISRWDRQAAARLRSVFAQVRANRKAVLEDSGFEVDTEALIERITTNRPVPCFRAEQRGRGLQILVLVDQSKSMLKLGGRLFLEAWSACRTIAEATRGLPGIELKLWGMTELSNGQLDVTLYDPYADMAPDPGPGGYTPIGNAVTLATEELSRVRDAKHIIIVTDGLPISVQRNGIPYDLEASIAMTRSAVLNARRKGISVTGVMIGSEIEDHHLAIMYGSRHQWRRIGKKNPGEDLVQLIQGAVLRHLKVS